MVAHFDAVRFNGYHKEFFQGVGQKVDFSGVVNNIFPGERQSDKNSFYALETKKTTFLLKFNGKMSIFKFQGRQAPHAPMPMIRLFIFILIL